MCHGIAATGSVGSVRRAFAGDRKMTRGSLLALAVLATALASADDIWTVQMIDPKGDAHGAPDAAQLSFRYDGPADMLWFRVAVYGRPDPDRFGVRLAFDAD